MDGVLIYLTFVRHSDNVDAPNNSRNDKGKGKAKESDLHSILPTFILTYASLTQKSTKFIYYESKFEEAVSIVAFSRADHTLISVCDSLFSEFIHQNPEM